MTLRALVSGLNSTKTAGDISTLKDVFDDAANHFISIRAKVGKPSAYESNSPFANAAKKVQKIGENLIHDKGDPMLILWDVSKVLFEDLLEKLNRHEATLSEFAGGSAKKNKSWKEDLTDTCSVDVLNERYKSELSRVNGKVIQTECLRSMDVFRIWEDSWICARS